MTQTSVLKGQSAEIKSRKSYGAFPSLCWRMEDTRDTLDLIQRIKEKVMLFISGNRNVYLSPFLLPLFSLSAHTHARALAHIFLFFPPPPFSPPSRLSLFKGKGK